MATENAEATAAAIVETAVDLLMKGRVAEWAELMDENVVFEFPYAPEGLPQKIIGKQAIADHLKGFPSAIQISEVTEKRIYQTLQPTLVIVEFAIRATMVTSGKPYNQHYICVVATRNGKIVHYRDYWNPLVVLETMDQNEQ